MALTEIVQLDIIRAQQQIERLEQQLAALGTPVNVPVNVTGESQLEGVRRELGLSDDAAERLNRELSQTDAELRQAGTQAKRTGDDIESAGRRGGTAFGNLRGSVVGLVGAFGAIQGARAFLSFAGDAIKSASDLEESTSKAQVVFGEFFDEIENFAQTGPQALGLANAQALEFTGTFGNLFVALGLSQEAAADLAPDIVQLGADLASFNNIEVTDALDKLRAGLVGESEPLRVLGVNLTAASTAAKAVELGLAASTTEVSEAAKVQARYAQILEQTNTAQGDFERTADGIANTQRTLAAEFENVKASIGEALLPLFADLVDRARELVPQLIDMIPALSGAADGLFAMLTPILDIVGPLATLVGLFGDFRARAEALQTSDNDPFRQIVGRIGEAVSEGAIPSFIGLLGDLKFALDTGVLPDDLAVAIERVNTAIEGGADPGNRVTRFLQEVARGGTITSTVLEELLQDIQLTEAEAARIRIGAREGLFGELSPAEIDAITAAMGEFIDVGGRFEGRAMGMGDSVRDIPDTFRGASEEIAEFNQIVDRIDFGSAAGNIATLTEAMGRFDVEVDFSDAVDEFNLLIEVTNEAGDEVPATVEQMITDLQTQADQFAQLEAATTILNLLGFDNLAADLRTRGPEAAQAAEDFVNDIAAAAEAEAIFTEGGNPGDLLTEQMLEALENGDVTPGLLALVSEFTSEDVLGAVRDAANTQVNVLREQLRAEIEAQDLDLSIPVNVIGLVQSLQLLGLGGLDASLIIGASGAGPNNAGTGGQGFGDQGGNQGTGTGGVTVNQNFFTEPTPTTDTARAAQQVNAIVGNQR